MKNKKLIRVLRKHGSQFSKMCDDEDPDRLYAWTGKTGLLYLAADALDKLEKGKG